MLFTEYFNVNKLISRRKSISSPQKYHLPTTHRIYAPTRKRKTKSHYSIPLNFSLFSTEEAEPETSSLFKKGICQALGRYEREISTKLVLCPRCHPKD